MIRSHLDRVGFAAVVLTLALAAGVPALAATSDDFNACQINGTRWTSVDPLGGSTFSLVGTGSSNARLSITVPAGLSHDPWTSNHAARLMQTVVNGNFQVQTKIESVLTSAFQEQGVMVEQDAGNWMRFDFVSDGTSLRVFAATNSGGVPTSRINQVIGGIPSAVPLYLRVTRAGTQWTLEYSPNGTAWTPAGTFSHTIVVNSVGVFAGNFGSSGSAPAHTALFDYFFDTASSVSPEDGALAGGRTLTVNTSGGGSVLRSPDQSVYYCNETVTLTGQPSAGWTFSLWSGAVTGSANPTTVAMTANRSVTATFIDSSLAPPTISNVQVVPGDTFATVTWNTSEPATSRVDWRGDLDVAQVLNYGFEEASGTTVVDATPNGPDGLLQNGATRLSGGYFGQAASFTGTGGNVNLGNLDLTGGAVSFALWFKADDFGVFDARLISKSTGTAEAAHWWMLSTLGNQLRFRLKTSTGTTSTLIGSGPALVAGQWTHVAATYDGAQMRIYQNGVLTGSLAKTGTIATNPSVAAWIGDNPSLGKSFDGLIDEVRIWSRVLNATEIAAEMQRPSYTDTAEDPTLAMTHQEILFGLTPLTQYHYMISAEDAGGATGSTPDATFTTGDVADAAFLSDDFNTCALGPWTFTNQIGDASYALEGPGTGNARLRISVPAGSSHDAWTSLDAPRITQPALDTDFQVETRIDSTFAQGVQEQGIVVETATGRWARFDFVHDGTSLRAFAAVNQGVPSARINQVIASGSIPSPLWLRVTRAGNLWTQDYSTDGVAWTTAGTFSETLTVARVGVFAGNFASNGVAPAFDALFDYVFETSAPVLPEDGGAVDSRTLSTSVAGNGSIGRSPNQPTYNCGEQVTLTATPAPGWAFSGWSGALNGLVNPANLSMTANYSVTATFAVDTAPPTLANLTVTPGETSATINWVTNEPSTSRVEFGETTASQFWDAIESTSMVAQHEITLTGLVPGNEYFFHVMSTDEEGQTATSAADSFTTLPETIVPFASDDFNDCDPTTTGPWTFVNPAGDASFSIAGAGTADVRLQIAVPGGQNHDPWVINQAPRLMQPANDVDFQVEVRIDSIVSQNTQQQGLIIEQDADDWLRFDFIYRAPDVRVFAARMTGGTPVTHVNRTLPAPARNQPLWMRVTRTGDLWRQQWSLDGVNWTNAGTFTSTLAVTSVGVFGGNYHSSGVAPQHTASFDYFFESASPIEPEDSGSSIIGRVLTVNVSGNGTVVRAPDLPLYYCSPEVSLTASPALGHAFSAWSGALTGFDPRQTLVMNTNRTVGATFNAAPAAPVVSSIEVAPAAGSAVVSWITNEPATSRIDFGLTAAYGQTVQAAPLTNLHSLELTGLVPNTLYHFRVLGVDSSGLTGNSLDTTFTTTSADFESQDFQTCALDPGTWTFVNPLGDASYGFSGSGTQNAQLTITVPPDGAHDAWVTNNAPRLMQPALDNDFVVEFKVESPLTLSNQMQGVIVEQDVLDWLRFDFVGTASNLRVFAARHAGGSPSILVDQVVPGGHGVAPLWMRITRAGHVWTQEYSLDGADWIEAGEFVQVLTVNSIGVFAGNANDNPPLTARFDYFFNNAAPVVPEDGGIPGPPRTLTANTVGNGTIQVDPQRAVYYCDEEVILTAEPNPGSQFSSWSGALTGNATPVPLVMSGNREVTGTFTVAGGPPVISDLSVDARDNFATVTWRTNEPASSRAEWGPTTLYGTFTESATLVTHHRLVLAGLTPETPYHFRVRSVDFTALPTISADGTFTTSALDVKSDDFNAYNLSTNWTFHDPLGDSGYSVSGAGSGDAKLSIHVPAGRAHDPWTTYGAPRLMQPALDRDFQIEVRIDAVMTQGNQQHGLLIEESETRWIRMDFVHNGESLLAFAASHENGVPTARIVNDIFEGPSPSPIWLRVTRTGDLWRHEYSYNGLSWLTGGTFIEPLYVTKIGLFAGNAAGNPAHTAVFDYFSRTEFPVTAEDQATPAPDTRAPAILAPHAVSSDTFFRALCYTDEPAVCHVDYGLTPAYELGTVSNPAVVVSHALDSPPLQVDTDYHYRIVCQDAQGNLANSGDRAVRVQAVEIDVFFGLDQSFGDLGVHQDRANILGNVHDPDGIASLTYALNGGPEEPLGLGPDLRRLQLEGDFAVEIDPADLQAGTNQVVITGTDIIGAQKSETVSLHYEPGNVWPRDVTIDWSQVAEIDDVARVVDGEWMLTQDGLRTVAPGYDRLVAIGDMAWTDYEVVANLKVHAVTPMHDSYSGGAAVGMILRWQGHTVFDEHQPRWGFWPLGALAWYRWTDRYERFRLVGSENNATAEDETGRIFAVDTDYVFRARVETGENGNSLYSARYWKAADPEPSNWDLQIVMTPEQGLTSGSVLLLAHHVDVTFGNLTITSLGDCVGAPRTLATGVVGSGTVERDPAAAEYRCSEDVTVTALPAPGFAFTGWSGDLTGGVNPGTVSMDANRTVTANFVTAPGSPAISNVEVATGDTWATVTWRTNEPATSRVNYGATAAYGSVAERQPLTTFHSVTLTGLTPETLYHFRVSGTDSSSLSAASGDAVFTTDPLAPAALASDDFNTCALDTNRWTFVNPFGLGDYQLAGGGSGDARLELTVAAGVEHDSWTQNNVPRLMQPVANTNFQLEVKFDSSLDQTGVGQGMQISQDSNDWLRFDSYFDGETTHAFAARITSGNPEILLDQIIAIGPSPVGLRLRVTRTGNQWRYERSQDGVNWALNGVVTSVMTAASAGPVISTVDLDGHVYGHRVLVDYFVDTASRVLPEDGALVGPGYALTLATNGNGSLTSDRTQPLFHCQEVVTLTAEPDPGSVFTGWTGDLAGVANPEVFAMTSDVDATANFGLNVGPPILGNVEVDAQHNWATVSWYTNEPATSRVDFGVTAAYGRVAQQAAQVIHHSVLLADLEPDTLYHFRVTSVDGESLSASTTDAIFTTPAFVPGPFLSDDFGACALNPSWTFVDPLGDGDYTLSGGGTEDGWLRISVPAGPSHNPWTSLAAPRLVQPLADEDFQVELRFQSALAARFQEQGVVAELNNTNFVRFEFFSDGTNIVAFASVTVGGVPTPLINQIIAPSPSVVPMGLRVTRVGDLWTMEHSVDDGLTWILDGAFISTLPANKIGPFAGNSGAAGAAPAHTAIIDYLFDTSLPVVPEDGPLGVAARLLSVDPDGSGQITVIPLQDAYYCDDQVTLTAVPAPGWVFSGWNGDLSGITNPETIVMSASRSVTALFDPNTTPPIIDDVSVAVADTSVTISWSTNEGASSRVNYGATTSYGQFVQNLTFKTHHSLTLTGLVPNTTYHFSIRSVDASGLAATTPDATFSTTPLADRPFESEDFDTSQLDSRIWTFHNPLGDASFFLTGQGTQDATVSIVVPAGLSHDAWATNNSPRLMQDAEDGDFQLEVKMQSGVSQRFQEQGVIVEADLDNWLRLEIHSNGTELRAFATAVVNGAPSVKINTTIGTSPSAAPIWLRVTRAGDNWTHAHSTNGVNWVSNGTFAQPLAVSAVGIHGGNFNNAGPAPAHTAVFDYFFEASQPIVPEDTPP